MPPLTVKFVVGAIAVAAGLLSGVFWVKAAYAKALAAPGSKPGVGYGGTPVNVQDHDGQVLDFLQSYRLQSKWNSRAALASAVTGIFTAISFLVG